MSDYTKTWRYHGKGNVPHITPNFNKIPRKSQENSERYLMFLKAILLVHKAGTTYDEVNALGNEQLEMCVKIFIYSADCPTLILEEYEESQITENNSDEINDDDPLQREPEPEEIVQEQDDIMCLMKPVETAEEMFYEVENDYENFISDHGVDWEQDRRDFGLTDDDLKRIPTWIQEKRMKTFCLS